MTDIQYAALFFYLGSTVLLLAHCVSVAYFMARSRRRTKQAKALCFASLGVASSVMIALLFFEVCFAERINGIDALIMAVPLLVCMAGDIIVYNIAKSQRYKLADGTSSPRRTIS